MSVVCGVDLSSDTATVVLVDVSSDAMTVLPSETKRVALDDDEDPASIRSFAAVFNSLVRAYNVNVIAIRKRAQKGPYAGGAITFKMEAVLQLADCAAVKLVSPQSIAARWKKLKATLPQNLNKYQEEAYRTAWYVASESNG